MNKVLILGENNTLAIQVMKEKYGDDIQVVTVDEAKEQGLAPDDFRNIPTYEIKSNMACHEIPFMESKRVGKGGRAKNRSRYGRK